MLIKEWKRVASISYSAWAFYALSALIVVPDVLWIFFEYEVDPVVIGRLLLLAVLFGLFGRLFEQTDKGKIGRRVIVGIILLTACALSAPSFAHEYCPDLDSRSEMSYTVELTKTWEGEHKVGEWHVGYLDTIAEPDLATACYGHTETAVVGWRYSQEQCDALLAADLVTYREGVRNAFTYKTKSIRITPKRGAAFTSLTYNIGIRAASRSTAVRRLNRGDIDGACTAMGWWNKSGGRIVRGLVNRRRAEVAYCMEGLA